MPRFPHLWLPAVMLFSGLTPLPLALGQEILPRPVEGETQEVLPDTFSPDEKLALAIRTINRSKTLSLEIVRPADGMVLWRSNPTGDDTDVFRYRLRAHGFRDMQYAWSPDSKLLAMALVTSRDSYVLVFQIEGDSVKSSRMAELSGQDLFGDQLPTDPAVVEKQGGVRKLYMNLEFTSNTVLEVSTEGFFVERETKQGLAPRKLYYEAVVAYDLDPTAKNKVPRQDVKVTPLSDLDDENLPPPSTAPEIPLPPPSPEELLPVPPLTPMEPSPLPSPTPPAAP